MNSPLLFLIFNRPDLTTRVFAAIRKAKPKRLYIAADGPRDHAKHDRMRCILTRDAVMKNIDWDCEVKTLFREQNLGCGLAVSEAISWFFEHEEEGIILEDDCLPDNSFFSYCSAMLEKFRHDERVMQVQGFSMVVQELLVERTTQNQIHATRIPNIWGWATWRRAWDRYQYDVEDIDFSEFEKTQPFPSHIMESIFKGVESFKDPKLRPDLWDVQWVFVVYAHLGYSICPALSLVENIGFSDGTHTGNGNYYFQYRKPEFMPLEKLTVPDNPEHMVDEIIDSHTLEIVIMKRRIPAGKSRKISDESA